MLKEMLLQKLQMQSGNVSNAIIQLGDIDDSGKGKRFKSRFIQPGLAGYPGQYGNILVKKETLDNSLSTIIGAPVIINHKDITPENADDERVGVISDAYYNEKDGWYWCEGVIWDETAQNLINDKKWSVSCSYDFLEQDDEGGTENNIPYDREFTKLNFVHLALVNNPRYERANIVFNSKTVDNGGEGSGNFDHAGRPGEVGGSGPSLTIEEKIKQIKPIKITSNQIPNLDTRKEISEWVKDIFKELGHVHINDTDISVELSNESAERETIKRRVKKEHNKAVYAEFEELVSEAIKTSDREKDDRHKRDQEIYYNEFELDGNLYGLDLFIDKPFADDMHYRYAGHKANKIAPRDTTEAVPNRNAKGANNSITDTSRNFNPDITKHEVHNIKEADMALLEELKKLINTVENGKTEESVDNEKVDKRKLIDEVGGILKGKVDEELWRTIIGKLEKAAYDDSSRGTADNEKVDKRDIIRQIMAIAGKHEDNEDVRTIAKLAEKLAYEKSEAGTADNAEPKKDENAYKEFKKEVKEDVNNRKKCDNGVDNSKLDFFTTMNEVYSASMKMPEQSQYVSRADKLKEAEEYFGDSN